MWVLHWSTSGFSHELTHIDKNISAYTVAGYGYMVAFSVSLPTTAFYKQNLQDSGKANFESECG